MRYRGVGSASSETATGERSTGHNVSLVNRVLAADSLGDQVAIVTGGGDSTGLVVAEALLACGAHVHIGEICGSSLDRALSEAEGLTGTKADIGRPADVRRLFDDALFHYGRIDLLVNLVGIPGPAAPVELISDEDFERTMRVNVQGMFYAIKEVVPLMKQAGRGTIINFSSCSTRTNVPGRLPYVASKWAVEGMTRALARELGPHGITVNALIPGMIDNDRNRAMLDRNASARGISPDDLKNEYLRYISTASAVSPVELAVAVAYLASPAARNITGQLIGIDGNVEWEF